MRVAVELGLLPRRFFAIKPRNRDQGASSAARDDGSSDDISDSRVMTKLVLDTDEQFLCVEETPGFTTPPHILKSSTRILKVLQNRNRSVVSALRRVVSVTTFDLDPHAILNNEGMRIVWGDVRLSL